jgi:hypothetical protein
MSETTTHLKQLAAVLVPVRDQDRAIDYVDKLGFEKRADIGLSEAGPATIRRAHAVHPIAALQTEYLGPIPEGVM